MIFQQLVSARDLISKGQLVEASTILRACLSVEPTSTDARFLMAKIARLTGNLPVASNLIEVALAAQPDRIDYLLERCAILLDRGLSDDLIHCYLRILELDERNFEAHEGLGHHYASIGTFENAREHLRMAVQLRPGCAHLQNLLGHVEMELGDLEEAERSFQSCLALEKRHPEALLRMGNLRRRQGRSDDAIAYYRQVLEINERHGEAISALATVCLEHCDAEASVSSLNSSLRGDPEVLSHMISALNYISGLAPELIAAAHFEWARRELASSPAPPLLRKRKSPTAGRQIRLGFVSADFCSHPVGRFMAILASHLNRDQFSIHIYDNGSIADAVTELLANYAAAHRSIRHLSDDSVRDVIAADEIDILIDLSGHTRANRLGLFARRSAPVQLSVFAYPNTTGLSAMDYRISDSFADPPGMTEHLHSEKLVRLPSTAWAYLPPESSLDVQPAPCSRTGLVSFGCLNHPVKISGACVRLWSDILKRVGDSRLILLSSEQRQAERLRQRFFDCGVAPERLVFLRQESVARYFQYFQEIDIALDPYPYNGGVSTCDALWMGVPVLTLAGKAYVARQGVSLLSNVGLPDWIASSEDEFVAKAVRWAGQPAELKSVRRGLRQSLLESPVCNYDRYAANLGQALVEVWNGQAD